MRFGQKPFLGRDGDRVWRGVGVVTWPEALTRGFSICKTLYYFSLPEEVGDAGSWEGTTVKGQPSPLRK
jgi:hypothetical protein